MNDRLDEIKRKAHVATMWLTVDDRDWLISEVERLTARCREARRVIEGGNWLDREEGDKWLSGEP